MVKFSGFTIFCMTLLAFGLCLPNTGETRVLNEARKAAERKQFDRVIELLEPIRIDLQRSGLLLLGEAYRKEKKWPLAERVLLQAMVDKEMDYFVLVILGEVLKEQDKKTEALEKFQQARVVNNRFQPAYRAELSLLKDMEKYFEARALVEDMVRIFGEHPEIISESCELYFRQGFLDQAEDICRRAMREDPSRETNPVFLAKTYLALENERSAVRIIDQAVERFPASVPVLKQAGSVHGQRNNYSKAYRLFQTAIKKDSESAEIWSGFAEAAFHLGQYEEALDAYKKACRIDRNRRTEFQRAIASLRDNNKRRWQARYETVFPLCHQF